MQGTLNTLLSMQSETIRLKDESSLTSLNSPRRRQIPSHLITDYETEAKVAVSLHWSYIVLIAIVDAAPLLQLIHGIPVWAHIVIAMGLSCIGLILISTFIVRFGHANRINHRAIKHLILAHNEMVEENSRLRGGEGLQFSVKRR